MMDRYFHAEHGAARAYLFSKAFLLLLAVDTWVLMIGHAGRYGVLDFNVAHFAWLDRILPVPSPGFYIGVLCLVGLLALALVFLGLHPVATSTLFVLYTFSWSMSMLDSYQHHYFMSLVLVCLIFFPQTSAAEVHPPPAVASGKGRRADGQRAERAGWVYVVGVIAMGVVYAAADTEGMTFTAFLLLAAALGMATALYRPRRPAPHLHSGWGFPLLAVTVAVLYTYTAVAKIDARWLAGDTLLRISRVEEAFGWMADYAVKLGVERERFWGLFATAVIPQELYLAASYLAAPHQDRMAHPAWRVVCLVGFVTAVALHVGAEAMGLEIGWFSYYMLALAVTFLLPLPVVDRLATVVTWPARAFQALTREWEETDGASRLAPLGFALGSAVMLAAIGQLVDLPGAFIACGVAGAALVAVAAFRVAQGDAANAKRISVAALLAGMGMWLALVASPVRFDFYRYLGGDLYRRGHPAQALEAYLHAERYAPEGESRAAKIQRLRRELGR